MTKVNIIAADIHKHMVTHSTHGYTQGSSRWGSNTTETITIDGNKYTIGKWDYDCSSSVLQAWITALSMTKYKGKIKASTYTGTRDMRSMLTKSGLFKAHRYPYNGTIPRGSIYLNDACHTGMYQGNGKTSEFLLNENGGIVGGKKGDQTGNESKIRSASAYGAWQWVLVPTSKLLKLDVPAKKQAAKASSTVAHDYIICTSSLRIRSMASTVNKKSEIVGSLKKGDKISLKNVKKNLAGNTWGKIASGKYKGNYIAVKFHGSTYAKKA